LETKQYSVKVFEATIADESEFIAFFDKNYLFFQHHLISIHGVVNAAIENYLKNKNLKYITNVELPKTKNRQNVEKEFEEKKELAKETAPEPQEVVEKIQDNLKVIDTLVRSGQELKIAGDLLLLNRVNSGGSVNIEGNLIITQLVEGSIRCNGNFMMIKASPKANIVFHDVEVDNAYLKERLNRVELKNNKIIITPVLKETSWE
jgi:septum site-determining protein MinC